MRGTSALARCSLLATALLVPAGGYAQTEVDAPAVADATGETTEALPLGTLKGRVILTDPTKRVEQNDRVATVATESGPQETLARITLFDAQHAGAIAAETHTDREGLFTFGKLEAMRKYTVRAERSRYRTGEAETTIAAGGITELTLRLAANKNVWWYFQAGGALMYVLLAISMTSVYVAIERGYLLLVKSRSDTGPLLEQVRGALRDGKPAQAQALLHADNGPVARVLLAGIERQGARTAEIEKTMENAAIQEIARLERGLAVLASASNIAPIIGFLGTVVGMIMAFDAIAEHGLSDPSYVADGISTALITTAGGLLVAVFALPVYHFLNARISIYARQMETSANLLLETIESLPT